MTNVSGVHLLEFKGVEAVAKEKEKILSSLRPGRTAVLNVDNEHIRKMKVPEGVEKITFGKKSTDIQIIRQDFSEKGPSNYFKVQGNDIAINSTALGEHILYTFAAALAVGISQKIEIEKMIKALESFEPARGRLSLIEGVNDSTIIDDSYNANPSSMRNALDVLGRIDSRWSLSAGKIPVFAGMTHAPLQGAGQAKEDGNNPRTTSKCGASKGGRKIALLGSMNELGKYEKEAHAKIGEYLTEKCDILVTVGEAAEKYLIPAALKLGIQKENVFSFKDSLKAGEFLKGFIKKEDVVLVKGSQNKIRLERAVKVIMKNPEDAPNVLCRQGKEWEKK
ncbi:MAG: hypothetical protein ACD_24C00287G0001 [uncultured bacterium]|nr:MAG: hypothetical protein ACD_24C00287G0001 [uncultured bacterium]